MLWRSGFPLVEALSSGDSAEALASLFAALTGRTAPSAFFIPFVIGFGFLHSLHGPATTFGAGTISRALETLRSCATQNFPPPDFPGRFTAASDHR